MSEEVSPGGQTLFEARIAWAFEKVPNGIKGLIGRLHGFSVWRFVRCIKEELLIVAANLDTFGEVPRLSPGARGAANCAALVKLAEHMKTSPPRRHVLLAFLDNQARGHAGAAAPVPAGGVRPAAPAHVEHAPRVTRGAAVSFGRTGRGIRAITTTANASAITVSS